MHVVPAPSSRSANDSTVLHDDALARQKTRVFGLVSRNETARRRHDPPPRQALSELQHASDGTRCAGMAGLGSHLAVGDDLAGFEAFQDRADALGEIRLTGRHICSHTCRMACFDARSSGQANTLRSRSARFESDQVDRELDARNPVLPVWHQTSVHEHRALHRRRREDLIGSGEIAESRRDVHRLTDVIVSLEEDHIAGGDSGTQRERVGVCVGVHDRHDGFDHRLGLHANDHRSVAEPLRDTNAVDRRSPADPASDLLEEQDRCRVAFSIGELGESRDIDERKGALDPRDSFRSNDVIHLGDGTGKAIAERNSAA